MVKIKSTYIFFRNMIKREIKYSTNTPTRLLLFMTYRCTSKCKMCTIWKHGENIDSQKELTLDELKSFFDNLDQKHVSSIEIFGGDSLLRKDVTIPFIEYVKEKNPKMVIDLPTNCNLLDEETAKAIVKAGVDMLYVSLDGPIETHDKIRGNDGTFNRVQKGLEYVIKAKKELASETPEIVINCTITSSNVDNFEKIIPSVEKIGVDGLDFEYVGEFKDKNINNSCVDGIKPTPFYITQKSSNLLNREQAVLLKKKMNEIRKSIKEYKVKISTRHIDFLTIDNLVNGTIPNKKCYMSRYLVTVDPFGNVMGCFHYNNFIMGNIKESSVSSIWKGKKHRSFLKAVKNGDIKICENCISGVNRNPSFYQVMHSTAYFKFLGRGFDSP